MRIALITDGIWPYVLGGMQKHSYYLCKYLAQEKVQVDLFHFNQSEYDISALEFFAKEEREYINSVVLEFPQSMRFPGHYFYNSYRYSKRVFARMQPELGKYDFIYTKGFAGWYLINFKSRGGVNCAPVGVKFHGYEMFQPAPNFKIKLQHLLLMRAPVRSISRKADVVFSYGGKITEIIRSLGVSADKIKELPSGVESSILAEKASPAGEKVRFLFLGRYERRKGIEELNEAIRHLNVSGLSQLFDFNFIGPVPSGKRIKFSNVSYHGEIRDKNLLLDLIRKNDILVCPSWSEGMPNVILEAMANGLAVVATNVGATNVLVNANTGWLLENSDPVVLTEVLRTILESQSQSITEKKENALRLITSDFTWEKLIVKFMGMIRKN